MAESTAVLPPGATEATTPTLEIEKLSTWRWTSIPDMTDTTTTMAEIMIHISTDMIDMTHTTTGHTTNMPRQQKTRR